MKHLVEPDRISEADEACVSRPTRDGDGAVVVAGGAPARQKYGGDDPSQHLEQAREGYKSFHQGGREHSVCHALSRFGGMGAVGRPPCRMVHGRGGFCYGRMLEFITSPKALLLGALASSQFR